MRHIKDKEIVKINNKEFLVTTSITEKSLSKESLIKLIVEYAMRELEQEELFDEEI